ALMTDKKAPRPAEGTGGLGPLILVVDDFEDNREMYTQSLRFNGYRVAEAVDGLDALTKSAALQPDLIVMDLSLPRLDGWEATRRLKGNSNTAHIPILACTAHAFGSAVERALIAGCDAYLVKPCLPEGLRREVRRWLAEFSVRRG